MAVVFVTKIILVQPSLINHTNLASPVWIGHFHPSLTETIRTHLLSQNHFKFSCQMIFWKFSKFSNSGSLKFNYHIKTFNQNYKSIFILQDTLNLILLNCAHFGIYVYKTTSAWLNWIVPILLTWPVSRIELFHVKWDLQSETKI